MSEEQAQQLVSQMQMLESYFADLSQRENHLVNILREARAASESIKNSKDNDETLIPLGLGTFVKAKLLPNEKVLVNIGAGAVLEKDKDAALNYIEARIKEIDIALKESATQKQEIAARLEQGKQEMNRLMQQAQSQKK